MSVIYKKSARLRDAQRIRLIWLLTFDKAITSALSGHLTLAERYDDGSLEDDLREVKWLVNYLPAADLADALEALPEDGRRALWQQISDDKRGTVLLNASESVRGDLMNTMSDQALLEAWHWLNSDEQVSLVQYLPAKLAHRLLIMLPVAQRTQISQAMGYADDSVGALMKPGVITVHADMTLAAVRHHLLELETIPENTDKLFVITDDQRLSGELTLQKILLNDARMPVSCVMDKEPVTFHPDEQAEKVARTFERDDLISAAVVDDQGKLLGRLTIDKIVTVIYQATDSDFRGMAGLSSEEDVFAPISKTLKTRWPWLAVNLCTAFIASRVIDGFEHTIARLVALAALMPVVAGIGGNTGNQTITMIVRAMALQQIHPGSFSFLLLREISVALINGVVWGGLMGVITWWLYHDLRLGGVMMLAMTLNLLLAAIMGVLIPLIMARLGHDPAVGSSVMITAITDTGGFFIFLGLATIFLM
ncbi:magnesium transporter [Enterobacteriaceae bacterium ESL0689]|nr:magnesium transporter [Enterobacteriaceae bacterium ESL0689]